MDLLPPKYAKSDSCPVRNILDRFGDKWSVLVILVLGEVGVMRFNELNHQIGDVSQKMLSVTLKTLEADGLVDRKAYLVIPPKVEYQLTPVGQSLLPLVRQLTQWAMVNMETIQRSREAYKNKSVGLEEGKAARPLGGGPVAGKT
ncbi:MAG: transcriptional regulator [Candidatus Lambdaproteobacteria bacterium RIFOXYD1_FULL_56_27]|uniref:Transcriptional regulator n=1 Tax=Candidatus Lambdaproteobacteria bacterium RIFOXYD2_FULL_56_26 TaxID=1817773 RepID=A0A1F6H3D2_9PROT|nr:MAG: transcriptional regulator [Candidatus Lambdaproteobacteria bacterium RIFOXYC1_FULL_56_13]OGH04889.1 MAG: transcriptional regulator [Candidatus Lambdaproteobacteria bacterium RIFOXYD2_FULL_56_26]OGH09354.1 MAG: transcriptional regulator [Candidatus Lambdaproteobacteria bacterium RIFOXYD1_FULL_56_27]